MKDDFQLSSLEQGYKHLLERGMRPIDILERDSYNKYFTEFGKVENWFYPAHRAIALQSSPMEENCIAFADRDIYAGRYPRYLPPYDHKHNFVVLYYVISQPVSHIVEGITLPLDAGDLLILSPGVRHTFSITSDEGMVLTIVIRCSVFKSVFSSLFNYKNLLSDYFLCCGYSAVKEPYLLCKTGGDKSIYDLITDICTENNPDILLSNKMVDLYFQCLCIKLMRYSKDNYLFAQRTEKSHVDNNLAITQIIRLILLNYNTITLQELAGRFNYSVEHVSRMIKAFTGENFVDIRAAARILNAIDLLENNPCISVEDISQKVGYSDVCTFCRAFKRYKGISLTEYRKTHL
jgi:AraC-like DNA-binding protein